MSKAISFTSPLSFALADDIQNPDKYIEEIEKAFAGDGRAAPHLPILRTLNHAEKVQWLLSLPDSNKAIGCLGYMIIITVYLCTMVIIGTNAAGDPIKEKKCEEKQVPKCVPKP